MSSPSIGGKLVASVQEVRLSDVATGSRVGTTAIFRNAQEAGAIWVAFLLVTFLWRDKEK